ncbi:MAG: hypothetical protein ACRDT8_02900 [Micromonosporaceae bacterium]
MTDVTDQHVTHEDEADTSTIDSLRALALEHEFDYQDADPSLTQRWGAPPFSNPGHPRALDVVNSERDGLPVVAFRFTVSEQERSASASTGYGGGLKLTIPGVEDSYLVVAAALPSPLPRFALAPQDGAVDEVPYGHVFELEDPGLAERYDVYAADGDVASAVMHLDAVQRIREHRTVDWRVEGRDVIAVDPLGDGERTVEEVLATIDAVAAIAKGIGADAYGRHKPRAAYPPPG